MAAFLRYVSVERYVIADYRGAPPPPTYSQNFRSNFRGYTNGYGYTDGVPLSRPQFYPNGYGYTGGVPVRPQFYTQVWEEEDSSEEVELAAQDVKGDSENNANALQKCCKFLADWFHQFYDNFKQFRYYLERNRDRFMEFLEHWLEEKQERIRKANALQKCCKFLEDGFKQFLDYLLRNMNSFLQFVDHWLDVFDEWEEQDKQEKIRREEQKKQEMIRREEENKQANLMNNGYSYHYHYYYNYNNNDNNNNNNSGCCPCIAFGRGEGGAPSPSNRNSGNHRRGEVVQKCCECCKLCNPQEELMRQ